MEIIDLFWGLITQKKKNCVEIVLIRSYSDPFFPKFGLNAKLYGVFSQNAGKYGPEKLRMRTLFMQQKPSSKSKEDVMMDKVMLIFQYKKNIRYRTMTSV